MPLQGHLTVERMCQLALVSHAGYYRYLRGRSRAEEEMAIRSAVQAIVVEHRWRYGYRRVTQELRTQGIIANHKRIARIMKQDDLLAVRRKWSQSSQQQIRTARIYLNLANRVTLSGPNQVWAADITYVRLASEYVYLAVVLDVYSRRVIGWALGRSLRTQLPLCALERAIANRKPPPGVVHHSNQGMQYASQEYMQTLWKHGMLPSMSRPSNPYDNATCESFLKTLKREEIYAGQYRDFEELNESIEEFIERYYNRRRLHSALGYRSPEAFETERNEGSRGLGFAAAIMNFVAG